ncbi:aminoglycoside phosphotransferase family protein [Streptomyces vinaceus]|uniref:aminoglycoside phosphotransferase family protein n=1 Tax=Streptomyces vinaceus TaxID=1960 RepID=UPI003815FD14
MTRPTRLLAACSAAMQEVLPEAGDQLLHCDLQHDNVLAQEPPAHHAERTRWLAIDPKPLAGAGHPGFELLPALRNRRWDDVVATGNVPHAVRYRSASSPTSSTASEPPGGHPAASAERAMGRRRHTYMLQPGQAAVAQAMLDTR